MQFSQYSMDSEKMPPIQQRTNNLDFMGVDYKTTVGNADVKASMETGLSNNFQGSTGLMRYHSAPSSFFSSLEEEENNNIISQYFCTNTSPPLQSRTKTMQQNQSSMPNSHLGDSKLAKHCVESNDYSKGMRSPHKLSSLNRNAVTAIREDLRNHHLVAIPENGLDVSNDTFGASQMSLGTQAQVSQPGRQQLHSYQSNPDTRDSLIAGCSMSKSTLIRHSSSPAGLLSGLGYADEGIGYSVGLGSSCGNIPAQNRVQSHLSCMQRNGSSPGLISQCSTNVGVPGIGERLNMPIVGSFDGNQAGKNAEDYSFGSGSVLQGYTSKSSVGSWDDAAIPPEKYAGVQSGTRSAARKRSIELNGKRTMQDLNSAHTQGDTGNLGASTLIYVPHNLPRSISAELAMDDLLQDSVPCRLRAKRGCATHPRSIAERNRRTRISEGMRKLQELVPNSDNQNTNIADMLDEAVLYLKVLQKQVQEFTEKEAKCTCMHRPDCAFKI